MTLLETLVVVAISVMISALAFPSLDRSAQSLALAEAQVTLVSNLRVARAEAIRTGRALSLSVAADGRSYRIGSRSGKVPDGSSLKIARDAAFFPDGSASAACLRLDSRLGQFPVSVNPLTGAVSAGAQARQNAP